MYLRLNTGRGALCVICNKIQGYYKHCLSSQYQDIYMAYQYLSVFWGWYGTMQQVCTTVFACIYSPIQADMYWQELLVELAVLQPTVCCFVSSVPTRGAYPGDALEPTLVTPSSCELGSKQSGWSIHQVDVPSLHLQAHWWLSLSCNPKRKVSTGNVVLSHTNVGN